MTNLQIALATMILFGVVLVYFSRATYRDTGPGTGYKGYTRGHRIMMATTLIGGIALIVVGALGLWQFR